MLKEKTITLNIWMITTVILAIALIFVLVSGKSFNAINPEEASKKAVEWIKSYFVANGLNVEVKLINYSESESGIYKFTIELKSDLGTTTETYYVTKDGKLFLPQAFETEKLFEAPVRENETKQQIEKTEKPIANAFIMSHCPFGIQFLKAYIPVIELLGNKAELNINFVNYIMHGKQELDDNMIIYCVQKNEKSKLTRFLRCFVESGNSSLCINSTGINKTLLNQCIKTTDEKFNITKLYEDKSTWLNGYYPRFPVDDELAKKYNVGGSPTFILNGKEIRITRSANAIKEAICSSFKEIPPECNTTLSNITESTGFGPIGKVGSSTQGQC
jgi:hypothetical protein